MTVEGNIAVEARVLVQMRANLVYTHLASAHHLALLAHRCEIQHQGQPLGDFIGDLTAYASSALILSACAVEAYINEVSFAPGDHFKEQSQELVCLSLGVSERGSVRDRLALLALLNGTPPPNWGCNPAQNLLLLTDFRNRLVHFHPKGDNPKSDLAKLAEKLRGKFPLNPFFEETTTAFPLGMLGYGCAKWAVVTASDFLKEFSASNGWPEISLRLDLPLPPARGGESGVGGLQWARTGGNTVSDGPKY